MTRSATQRLSQATGEANRLRVTAGKREPAARGDWQPADLVGF